MYVRVNAIIITKILVFLLCKFWTTCAALGVIFCEFINHSIEFISHSIDSLVTLYRVTNEFNSGVNIILVNLLDSDWLKTVPIKH